jgi:predicted transcriptional regulator
MPRKTFSNRIDIDLQKSIKKLAIDLEKPTNDLLEEAIRDLLNKYHNPKSQKK